MNQKNLEYLQTQVRLTGFGDELEYKIHEKIKDQPDDFKLEFEKKYLKDDLSATLHFSKSQKSDFYFFNKYDVTLHKENPAENISQTFFINRENNTTLKEAYNLISGRSVNKELTNKDGQEYNAWQRLDFTQKDNNDNFIVKKYGEKYGYDLEAALAKHPIKELANESIKADLISSLNKGNLQAVTLQIDGEEHKRYIEANPQFKTINMYDSNAQRMDNKQSQSEKQSEGESQSAKQDNKQAQKNAADDGEPGAPKAENKRKRGQSV